MQIALESDSEESGGGGPPPDSLDIPDLVRYADHQDPRDPHDPAHLDKLGGNFLHHPAVMGSLEKLISESYKFIRMADDLHDVASYLNDMRICFIALTVTGYIVLVIYLFVFCFRRSRRNQPRRRYGDYQLESQREFNNTQTTNDDILTTVRSDANSSYMGRNHHRSHQNTAPTFMRHGHMNHQQTTRLVADNDGSAVKHQIPHITTEAPTEEKAKVPQLVKDSIDS